MSARRAWLIGWLAGPLIGIANGTLREVAYKDQVGELPAHQISVGTAIALFAGYFRLLAGRWPLSSTRDALQVGSAWLALTVAFEFGFGRGVRPQLVGRAAGRLQPAQGPVVAARAGLDRPRARARRRPPRA
jgi:hypothetical protein